jgi:hypothetical protein
MLDAAARAAPAAQVKLKLIQGSSSDLGPHLGRFQMVVMGRSFQRNVTERD